MTRPSEKEFVYVDQRIEYREKIEMERVGMK